MVSGLPAEAVLQPAARIPPRPNSNTQQTKNETADVVVQQRSPKLLKVGILMPETC